MEIFKEIIGLVIVFIIGYLIGDNNGYNYLWDIYTGKRKVKYGKNPFLRKNNEK